MSRYKKFTESILNWIKTNLVLAIGIALGVAFLISNGPLLQQTSVALFDVSQPAYTKAFFLAELP